MLSSASGNTFYKSCCWASTSFIFVQNEKCRCVTHMLMYLLIQHSVKFTFNQYTLLMYSGWNHSEAENKSSHVRGLIISQNVGLPECLYCIHHSVRIECCLSRIISFIPLNLPGRHSPTLKLKQTTINNFERKKSYWRFILSTFIPTGSQETN